MTTTAKQADEARAMLPLAWFTPETWAPDALRDPLALLNDHAHLEKKAATNALALLLRWPEPNPPENWVQAMTSIASDEIAHLNMVTRLLSRRGGELTRRHLNPYANSLRDLARFGTGIRELIDLLLISALIEARSCERFALLADACEDQELSKMYAGLYASEAGHYREFLGLAKQLPKALGVDERWEEMLAGEAKIIQAQKPGPSMHSGVPAA